MVFVYLILNIPLFSRYQKYYINWAGILFFPPVKSLMCFWPCVRYPGNFEMHFDTMAACSLLRSSTKLINVENFGILCIHASLMNAAKSVSATPIKTHVTKWNMNNEVSSNFPNLEQRISIMNAFAANDSSPKAMLSSWLVSISTAPNFIFTINVSHFGTREVPFDWVNCKRIG